MSLLLLAEEKNNHLCKKQSLISLKILMELRDLLMLHEECSKNLLFLKQILELVLKKNPHLILSIDIKIQLQRRISVLMEGDQIEIEMFNFLDQQLEHLHLEN